MPFDRSDSSPPRRRMQGRNSMGATIRERQKSISSIAAPSVPFRARRQCRGQGVQTTAWADGAATIFRLRSYARGRNEGWRVAPGAHAAVGTLRAMTTIGQHVTDRLDGAARFASAGMMDANARVAVATIGAVHADR